MVSLTGTSVINQGKSGQRETFLMEASCSYKFGQYDAVPEAELSAVGESNCSAALVARYKFGQYYVVPEAELTAVGESCSVALVSRYKFGQYDAVPEAELTAVGSLIAALRWWRGTQLILRGI
jgi:hypothetical protein